MVLAVVAATVMGQSPEESAAPAAADAAKPTAPIRFNFKGATFDQVIDFFSRATGLPVVKKTDVPDGTLDYLSPESYDLSEALRVLNIILQAKGVLLRVSGDMLYLQKLTEMQRENIPTFIGELPAELAPNEIVTVVRPLSMALAKPLAEKLATMVAEYGSITAMEQQNSLVITETTAQVRRLLRIIDELDRSDPEGAVEIFAIRHARASALMEPLKALLSHKVEKYVIDQKGQQVKIEEESLPGLSMSADDRTNAIIAKGVQSRLDKLREAIALLDVPAVGNGRQVRTFTLVRLAPSEAADKLHALYTKLPEADRPTILALDDLGKVTVVGPMDVMREAEALLREIDGGAVESSERTRTVAALPVEHGDPAAIADALRNLLNGRQLTATRMLPGPDGRSLIVSGLMEDVHTIQSLLAVLDRPAPVDRHVRLLRLAAPDAQGVVRRARDLYGRQLDLEDSRWKLSLEFDPDARVLTAIGPTAALDRFAETLRLVEDNTVIDRETRQIELAGATPSRLVEPVGAMARKLLQPRDGGPYIEPVIEPVDALNLLIVTALPQQFAVLQTLIETLDRPSPEEFTFRVVLLSGADAGTLIEKAGFIYERLTRGVDPQRQPPPAVEFDPLTGNLLITGRTESVHAYEQAVAEARRLLPPARTGKLLALQNARAADVLESLEVLLARTAPVDPGRAVPPPRLEALEQTNSLYVVAEPSQHELIARYVRQLDTLEPTELPPLRLIQVRTADAMQIAALLRKRYDARPAEQRRAQPVEIDADAATNTLVVAAHTEVFDDINSFVDGVNRSGGTRAEHETMLFSLKRARAADVAAALDRLYPQPPMPTDRRGRPLPHLREPKPVHVSADAATNTLIIEALAERRPQFEALVAQLDRVEMPPQAELRTYHIERGDPAQIARTLNDLARQGVLSQPSSDGKVVQVTIQAEPVSRTLIVAGDTLTFEKIEQVLNDLQAVPVPRSLRVFEVTGAEPQKLADQAIRLYQEQTTEIPGAGEVSVEVDRTHGTLFVVADSEAMLRFMSILDELQGAIGPPPEVRLVTLEYADADEVVRFLRELAENELALMTRQGGPPPVFHSIEQTNAVLVAARPDQQAVIRSLIGSLDRPQSQSMPPLRILQLRTADATNLAAALARQYNQRHPQERRDKPVTISADSQTNTLIVAAHPAVLPEIEGIVRALNDADRLDYEGREIRIFPLQVARAEELARTIDEMFPQPPVPRDRRGRPLYHLQAPREVVVRADPQTNSLIVDAPILRMVGFENLVEQLDRQKIADETEVRTYPVVHADLEALASTLQKLASDGMLSPAGRDRRVPIAVTMEPLSRTLIVSGPTDIFERTEQVLRDLDVRRAGPSSTLRFFRLTNARAESLVPMLRAILVRRVIEEVEEAGSDPEALISISAERKSNTLIISAPQAIMPVADALVAELDHPRAAVDVLDVRVFTLAQADAAEVAKAVREGFQAQARAEGDEPAITIAAEPSSNSIVVTATPRQVDRIEAIIASLDGALPADQPQVRTVFLKHARAQNVAPIVEQLLAREELLDLNMLPSWARVGYLQMQMQQGDPTVRIAADVSLNAVVIAAPPALLNMAEQMIVQLDVDPAQVAGAAKRSVRVMLVENADAAAIASNIEAIFERGAVADVPPMIRVDTASNSLLVLATDAQFKTIEDVVSQIDRATIAGSRQIRMIPIDPGKASAQELARTLKRLLDRGHRGGVEIISVEQLLERRRSALERPPEAAKDSSDDSPGPTSALPTDKETLGATPRAVVRGERSTRGRACTDDSLRSLSVAPFQLLALAALSGLPDPEVAIPDPTQADPPATADREPAVTIAVDPDTNSLIVIGSPRAIERVADLARQLQDEIPALPGKVRYIDLPTGADARMTANLIGQTLSQMTPPGGRRGDLRRRVAVIADPTNNAVIIACNDLDFEVVGDLIVALTQARATEQIVVKVYRLQMITAERAAESVRNLLAPEAQRGRRGRQAQRIRDLAVKLLVDDRVIEAVFDPNRVSVSSDPQANALIVMGPAEAVGFVDQFIELIDQTPAQGQTTLKLYALQHARASDLQDTLRRIFVTRYQSLRGRLGPSTIQPEFSVDDRTNTLLVTASPEQLAEVDTLLQQLDRKLIEDPAPLRIIELSAAEPKQAAEILNRVVIGTDQARRASTLIMPDNTTGVLLVRAPQDVMDEIDMVLAEIDRRPTREFKVRTIVLERADANAVASTIQRLYDDRARIASAGRGRREQARRVSVIGDRNSSTLLVAASDDDFEEIQQLVAQFDTPAATQALSFRVFELEYAKAADIEDTVESLINDITWSEEGPWWWGGRGQQQQRGRRGVLAVRADTRLNALIVTGEGDKFDVVEKLIDILDAPPPEGEQRLVKLYPVMHADIDMVAGVLMETYTDMSRARRWWEPPDPTEIKVRSDALSKTLIVSGSVKQHEEIAEMIAAIDEQVAPAEQEVGVLPVEFAQAPELARTLNTFLRNRARATRAPPPSATIVASRSANTLVVSAEAEDLATIRDLLARLDQPSVSGDRTIEIVVLQDGDAAEIARIVRQQFGRRGGTGVIVTPDVRTNSLIVNAPKVQFAQAVALIERLDAPSASDETIIRTYSLEAARAEDVVRILSETLNLDDRGRTTGITVSLEDSDAPPVEVNAKIVADRRSNSLVITATRESFPVLETLIGRLDEVPAASPVEYRIIPLRHASAPDVAYTLRRFASSRRDVREQPQIDFSRLDNELIIAATADQFEQIEQIVAELDQPSDRRRVTDFVPLKYAEAEQIGEALNFFYGPFAPGAETPGEQNVQIVADPATNSLVISAHEAEWESIRALLAKLDSEEYDASLQLRVIALTHADANSVARAINEAFQGRIGRQRDGGRGAQGRRRAEDGDRREAELPAVLVEAEEWVRASAEPFTNSVIVSASRSNIRKIEQIIERLDAADYAKLPPPQIIAVRHGSPEQLAEALRELYQQTTAGGDRGRRSLRIVGDTASNTVIVRAEEEEFRQIQALAEVLQQEASVQGLSVHVLKLHAAPAVRVASAIEDAFAAKARQEKLPFSIKVDASGNSLVVACTGAMFAEIHAIVEQLDELVPAPGQRIFIIELEHVSPDSVRSVIESIGLDKPQPADSVSRLVTEPIKVSLLRGRNALVVVANAIDRDVIVALVKAIDAEPQLAQAQMRVIKLRRARAEALARILNQLLSPAAQQADTALARAVQEQVRRLSVHDGRGPEELRLDLTKPIRVIADPDLNALLISSTASNVLALEQIVLMLDQLPITDAVTVQIFPLENIAADQFARIVREIFAQGKALGGVPGSPVEGVPEGMVGKALLDEIALSVDDRTNTLIVAGAEDAVALVEVLKRRLDSDITNGWIEPRIIVLRHADATDLADTLRAILVEGIGNLPQSTPIQRQVGRLRMARIKENGGRVLESDIFTPMTRLVIRPDSQLNALILVGTPINLEVVSELTAMLDVEAASPNSTVRIYPVEHASAVRLATTVTRLFDQQVQSKAIRPEDRLIVQADDRTNSLIVTTSRRSFTVLEHLLEMLDAEIAPDLREIRRIELHHASATRLAQLIQQLVDARLDRLRRVQPETAELERASIIADVRTNSLIVAAGNESFAVIQRLAEEMDASTLSDRSVVEVLTLTRGNLERVADAITTIMERRYADLPAELRRAQQPLVLTDPRSNSLLVAADRPDMATIKSLVAKLEATPVNPAISLYVVPLVSMRAELLAPRLQTLMRQRRQSLGAASTPSDHVTIEPDLSTNSLIIAASRENHQVILGLIEALGDAEGRSEGGQVEIIQLISSRASDMVGLLEDLYVQEANRTRGPNTIRVTADERLNAVVVNAPPSDVSQIRVLVAQLDGMRPATVVEIKYIALDSANALETVSLIENVLSGRGIGTRGLARRSRQATVLRYVRQIATATTDMPEAAGMSEVEVSTAIRESINLTPDLRTNTVIVSAPHESMRMIEQMIRDIDASSMGAQNVRIFKLKNADALAMAEILTDLFNLARRGNLYVLKPREADPAEEDRELGAALETVGMQSYATLDTAELTAVPDDRQQLSLTVDNRTNSLLATGTPAYLDLVSMVVEELDALEATEREVFVYQLHNAIAAEVASVISSFVEQEQQKLISTLGVEQIGSAARLLEREITIVGDDASNTLLVSTSPRYMDRVKAIIAELDVDPPQVLIQVLIAEVTLDSMSEWGPDVSGEFRVGSATVAGSSGLGVLGSAFVSALGVPSLSVTTTDFDLLLRALESQGRLQVLSNPSVMAANNQPARIQVGENIGRASSTSLSDGGTQQTIVEFLDIGTILEVTASINPDGFVRMKIMPEILDLTNRFTQVSEDLEVPILTKRTATTTVTVRDGQTIVLGGLISDQYERRESKVPFLGDIPLLGWLFRRELEERTKTELIIVLTPHIITSPAELSRVNYLTDREIDRLSLSPQQKASLRRGFVERDDEPNPSGGDEE